MTQQIKNVAVIAHVDHGKTTIIDALLKKSHIFRENQQEMQQERILDSNDLEREKGITIKAKNCAIEYKDFKINIIDTPGHADFSGEVERTLNMADGALLIIDAQEGPMPQTRFVLKKALEMDLKIIVVINKIDKPNSRIEYVINKTTDLILELATKESQLDFPILFAIGREGKFFLDQNQDQGDVSVLLDAIIKDIPSPEINDQLPLKLLVTSLDYDSHLGRLLIGRVRQGVLKPKVPVVISSLNGQKSATIDKIFTNQGLDRIEATQVTSGDIAIITGVDSAIIGDTICDSADTSPLEGIEISEPTIHMTLGVNTSPFSGKEGKFTTSRQLEERLNKELETNLSLKVEKLDGNQFKLSGRGELHLAILLETLRREGYEMQVGKPEAIIKKIDGVSKEPIEELNILVMSEYQGVISQELGKRHAQLIHMEPISEKEIEFVYHLPTKNLLGLRSLLFTATKGTVIFNSQHLRYDPVTPSLPKLRSGVLIASEPGEALAYALEGAQNRGITFIDPGVKVYEGMIIGENSRFEDIEINVCKGKKLTNMRSKSSDGIIKLVPSRKLSLEQALDFLETDELLEITPVSLRLRKKHLTDIERRRNRRVPGNPTS